MRKRFIVDLTHEEQASLAGLLRKGVAPARKLTRARILLLANDGGSDQAIAAALHVHPATVERTRRRFVEGRLARALTEKPRPGGRAKLDGRQEAFLIALACSQAPEGRSRWTLQLLADRLVELAVVDSISDETVRRPQPGRSLSDLPARGRVAHPQAPGVPRHAQARLVAQHGRTGVLRARPAMPRPPPAGSRQPRARLRLGKGGAIASV
jgi:transposase